MRFAKCRYLPQREVLAVSFRNGDAFQIPVETLLRTSAADADWNRIKIGETGDFLELPTSHGLTEIPWDRVRCVADPEYRRHLAERAAASARRVGSRLQSLRRASGLTQEAVAQSAGVDRVTISRIENGHLQATYETLARIVATLGRTMQDLAVEETVAAPLQV
jgi:DNA-binding XRE family transcriptional regulator